MEFRESPVHGLGVFATRTIDAGDVVEHAPVLVVEADDVAGISSGSLSGYAYDWGEGRLGLALGYGSLYNHDLDPSAEYEQGQDGRSLVFLARRRIGPGEEITIDYSGDGTVELWFEVG